MSRYVARVGALSAVCVKRGAFRHASRFIGAISMALDDGCRIGVRDEVIGTEKAVARLGDRARPQHLGQLPPLRNNNFPQPFAPSRTNETDRIFPSAGVALGSRGSDRVQESEQLRRLRTHKFVPLGIMQHVTRLEESIPRIQIHLQLPRLRAAIL